jgi:chitin synthase
VDFSRRIQSLAGPGVRRAETRRVKIRKGHALSLEYEVPSAVQHAIQKKYRGDDLETGSQEFSHIRCKLLHDVGGWVVGAGWMLRKDAHRHTCNLRPR